MNPFAIRTWGATVLAVILCTLIACDDRRSSASEAGNAPSPVRLVADRPANPTAARPGEPSAPTRPRDKARDEAAAMLERGLEALVVGSDRKQARALFEQAAQRDPTFAAPHYNIAQLDEADQEWDAAIARLQKVGALAPNSKLAERAKAGIVKLTKVKELWATPEGRKTVRYDMAVEQARMFLRINRAEDAMTEASSALQVDTTRHEARLVLADALTRVGKYDAAVAHLKLAAEASPALKEKIDEAIGEVLNLKKYDALVSQADAALGDANYRRAADLYQEAWRVRPEREACGLRMAMALGFAGEFAEAQKTLEKLVASKSPEVSREAANQLATLRTLREQDQIMAKARKDAAEMRKKTTELAKQMGIELGAEPDDAPTLTTPPKPAAATQPAKPPVKDPVLEAIEQSK